MDTETEQTTGSGAGSSALRKRPRAIQRRQSFCKRTALSKPRDVLAFSLKKQECVWGGTVGWGMGEEGGD